MYENFLNKSSFNRLCYPPVISHRHNPPAGVSFTATANLPAPIIFPNLPKFPKLPKLPKLPNPPVPPGLNLHYA